VSLLCIRIAAALTRKLEVILPLKRIRQKIGRIGKAFIPGPP